MLHSQKSPSSDADQELLSVVLELIPFVVFWKGRDLRYLGCNAAFAGLAGFDSPAEIVGLTDYELAWSREESDAYRSDDMQVIECNEPKLHIVEAQTNADGRVCWLDTSKVPLRGRSGEVIGVLGIFADITKQRENEEELKRTRSYLEEALRAIDSGIVLYDKDERLVFCNDKYRELYRVSQEQTAPGLTYEEVLTAYATSNPHVEDPVAWVQTRLTRHRAFTPEWTQMIGNKTIKVSDRRTDAGGIVSLRTDVTEFKAIENELRSAKEAAELANAAKSAFLANMSHEIRTPMSAILGFTDLLIEDEKDTASLHSLETIKRNAEGLLGLINDILDLSKVEAGSLDAIYETCSPSAIVANVATLLSVRAEQKGVKLIVETTGPIPTTIQSDADRLQQILVNLVGNALKFTSDGTVTVRVRWSAEKIGGRLTFEISDTGIGMNPEQLAKIFRPFEQADSSTTRNFGGTGLGLTISKRLAELLGGQIFVTSVPGEGSCFSLEIPIQGEVELSDETSRGQQSKTSTTSTAAIKAELTGVRVLLVEDGRDNQRLITRVLTRAGATVEVCEDGIEAVEALEGRYAEFDVVLMDMQMPRLDGYGATRQLRANGFQQPIVALTAHAMSGDREECLAAGCNDYLTKPVKFANLVETCARLTNRAA